jgi:3-hydroxyisobutyrate dehydrogenase-like beta-hydroxyacid dehydrogenase
MNESIGFIGLGNMGRPMVSGLLKAGYAVKAYNRDPSKLQAVVEAGAESGSRPSDVTKSGGIVISMVANDAALEEITLGQDGLLAHLGPGGIHISMSTVSPEIARKMHALHEQQGCSYVAAPVFGRPEAAANKLLWVAVAGDAAAKERIHGVLDALGQGVFDFGEDPSNANIVKLSGNFLIVAAMEAMGEVALLAEKNGVDRSKMIDMFSHTIFASSIYQNYGKRIAEKNFSPVGFEMKLGLKDVNLVLDVAEQSHLPLPLVSLAHDRFVSGIAKGRGEHDWMEIVLGASDDAGMK